jgi:RNA polymerase sigma factor (sigma-70 family)
MKTEDSDEDIREKFFILVSRHLKQLYEFVRHQLAYLESMGDIGRDDLTAKGVVDEVVIRAYREFVRDPSERDVGNWFIELAKKQLNADVERLKTVRGHEPLHIEEDIPETLPSEEVAMAGDEIFEFYQPDEDWKLEDVLPDLSIPPPDQAIELRRLWRCVDEAMVGLPEQWRRAFQLRYVDELSFAQVANDIGTTVAEVERMLEHARQYVRQRLVESGCRFKDTDEETASQEGIPSSKPG